jgi:TrpR-related protein YerC/YecD
MAEKWDNSKTEQLIEAILALKNKDEARRFLRDLLTEAELVEFGNRWKAVRMLSENKSYTTIRGKTGLSSATIARISKWLREGMGGYQLMLNRLGLHHHTPSLLRKG